MRKKVENIKQLKKLPLEHGTKKSGLRLLATTTYLFFVTESIGYEIVDTGSLVTRDKGVRGGEVISSIVTGLQGDANNLATVGIGIL